MLFDIKKRPNDVLTFLPKNFFFHRNSKRSCLHFFVVGGTFLFSQKNSFSMKTKFSPFNSVQDALSIKLWGPFFDDFEDMSIFIVWGPSTTTERLLDIPLPLPLRQGKKYVVRLGSSLRLESFSYTNIRLLY